MFAIVWEAEYEYTRSHNILLKATRWRATRSRNDPYKNCSIFYSSVAIRFLPVETVVFSDEEFINR